MLDFHLHLARLPNPQELDRQLAQRGYRYIAVAYGIHPMVATETTEEQFSRLADFLLGNDSAMVGEAGIDKRYPGYDAGGAQEKVFLRQAKLALELGRDLQIHCVGDYGQIIKLLLSVGFDGHGPRPVFHRFGGDTGTVRAAFPLGALFSLHPDCFRKKSTAASIKEIPFESIRFETDADETFMQEIANENEQECTDFAVQKCANLSAQKCGDMAVQKCADSLIKRLELVNQKFKEIYLYWLCYAKVLLVNDDCHNLTYY